MPEHIIGESISLSKQQWKAHIIDSESARERRRTRKRDSEDRRERTTERARLDEIYAFIGAMTRMYVSRCGLNCQDYKCPTQLK